MPAKKKKKSTTKSKVKTKKKTTKKSSSKATKKKSKPKSSKKKASKAVKEDKVVIEVEKDEKAKNQEKVEEIGKEAEQVNPDDLKLKKVGGKYVVDNGKGSTPLNGDGEKKEVKTQEVEKSEPSEDVTSSKPVMPTSEESRKVTMSEEIVPLEKKNTKLWITGLILAVIVFGTTSVLLYFRYRLPPVVEEEQSVELVEEEVKEEEYVAEELSNELERGEISLDVMNGSGVAGLAGETAQTFEDLGYEIYEIGNAELREGNEVYVKQDLEEELDKLMSDLEDELGIASVSGYLEESVSSASARIILGE